MKITSKQLVESAKSALENWDSDLMVDGQAKVLQAIIDNPANFTDNVGTVDTGKRDVWDYLEEISSSLAG